MSEAEPDTRPAKAGFNQFFVCLVCSKAFSDRAAASPIEVSSETALVPRAVPHPRYPDDETLATTEYSRKAIEGGAKVPAAIAGACCPTHTVLCDSRHFTISLRGSTFEITAAKHLE